MAWTKQGEAVHFEVSGAIASGYLGTSTSTVLLDSGSGIPTLRTFGISPKVVETRLIATIGVGP